MKSKVKITGGSLLSDEDVRTLRKMAERFRKEAAIEEDTGTPSMDQTPDIYIAKVPAGGIPSLTDGAVPEPGSAACDIYRIYDDAGVKKLYPMSGLSKIVYNLATTEIASGYVLVTKTKGGQWAIMAGSGSYYKHLGRFTLDEELTTSMESVWGTMTHEYGEGTTHIGHDAGTGTGTGTGGTSVKLHNFETHTSGTYEFYADAGDAVLAYYDRTEGETTGTATVADETVEHWQIIIPECP